MSEFSEAMYLADATVDDAVRLLRRARVRGYVFPSENGWVPVLFSKGTHLGQTEHFERLIAANEGSLLHYAYAEDHGCDADIYDGTKRVGRLRAAFEEKRADFDRTAFLDRGLLTPEDAEELARWTASAHDWKLLRENEQYIVARKLRLPRHVWFSFSYELENRETDAARIEVDPTASVEPKFARTVKKVVPEKPVASKKKRPTRR